MYLGAIKSSLGAPEIKASNRPLNDSLLSYFEKIAHMSVV